MKWDLQYNSRRMPVLAKNIVETSQPLAAQAGLRILQEGGNAVDAAIAAAITLVVVEPVMNGLGSDAFAIICDNNQLYGLNASGRAPAAWIPEYFAKYNELPRLGCDSVTVPGAVSSWVALSQRFGKLPFRKLFESAINYAENGFLVSPLIAKRWQEEEKRLKEYEHFSKTFLVNGQAPKMGELFKCSDLAKTLLLIAETNGEAFYKGELAKQIIANCQEMNGAMALEDLVTHKPSWVSPISQKYKEYEIYEMPPNSQGITVLIALGILKNFNVTDYPVDSANSIHLQIEIMKLAFADAKKHISDPNSMDVTQEYLLDSKRLEQLAKQIRMDKASFPLNEVPIEKGTVYLTTADSNGMMVSFIQSNFIGFGSGIVIPKTGISMQNRGIGFNYGIHPNQVGSKKLPFHTIIPAFIFHNNMPLMSFGLMGGDMQAQGHLQFIVRTCDYQQNPQAAIDAPRWYIAPNIDINFEKGTNIEVLNVLSNRGHKIVNNPSVKYGGAQAIYCLKNGYLGASDSRKDGQALGF